MAASGKKKRKFEYDVAVIGGGSAGYAAARVATAAGLRTAVIEGGEEVGGLCILRGCMPSKALLYAAEVLHLVRAGATWGLRIPQAGFDFAKVMARKRAMVKEFADYRRGQLVKGKFDFLRARARFIDSHQLELAGEKSGRKLLTARHFILSTGSVASPPPCPGLAEVGFWTSDEALSLQALPQSLIVLGGGSVALELAQFFVRLDVRVTLIQRGEHVLRESDADAATVVERVLRKEGVEVFTGTKLVTALRRGKNKGIIFEHKGKKREVIAQEILMATGRRANTEGLGLESIGVKLEEGRIVTNAAMQTSAGHVFAAGDCTGPHEIVHIAVQQGEVAAHNVAHPRKKRRMDYRLLISVVFTDPQVATVGLTEKEAKARGVKYIAASYPFADHGKSIIMEATEGFVKLLADPKTGKIMGGTCVGPMGGELIHEIVAAMRGGLTVEELAVMPHYHPTLAEIWTYPAEELAEMRAGQEIEVASMPLNYNGGA
jgi:pyruvate/2-oxoglutarate dehydrogenase complex dihydrolipoamide dehydrogenase (E3) component